MPYAKIMPIRALGETVDAALVLNKDGSMQTTWSYVGPDLASSTPDELAYITQTLNNTLSSIDTGFVLYFEAQRHRSTDYGTNVFFPDPLTKFIDEERRAFFQSGEHFESEYYCTLYWMPPTDTQDRMADMMIEGKQHHETTISDVIEKFLKASDQLISIFKQDGIPSNYLDVDEMLTYLHATVSDHRQKLKLPEQPILLDKFIYDTPLYGGLAPKLGKKHLRVVTPTKYPGSSVFGFFDVLNSLNFEYRWVTRFYCLGKLDSISQLEGVKRQWYGKIKPMMSMIKETFTGNTSAANNNVNAEIKYNEVKDAITAVENDTTTYGYYSTELIIMEEDEARADAEAKIVVNTFLSMNLQAKSEGLNCIDAWMGSIPGNVGHFIRRPIVSCGNLIHMLPISNIWAGPEENKHLQGPPLIYGETRGNTPFRLNLHIRDLGHSMLLGQSGGGKSVHLNLIEAQFRKYKDARVFIFDKGSSSIALTLGVGGDFYDLGNESAEGVSFQPLLRADDINEQQWLLGWLSDFIESENVKMTPELTHKLLVGLQTVAAYPDSKLRRMTNLMNAVNDQDLKIALQPLTISGAYGRIFDADEEKLNFSSWQTFEMEKIMQMKQVVGTTLMYIFHRIEQNLDGSPTLIVLDECWVFFQNEQFAKKIQEWLRVLRKANASVLFATQEIEAVIKSPIFDTINTNCATKIFLPDNRGLTPEIFEAYAKFGLNRTQVNILHNAQVKHDYYYFSTQGARLYDLALEACPLNLAYVGVNAKDVRKAKELMQSVPREQFNIEWLKYKHLAIEADNTDTAYENQAW